MKSNPTLSVLFHAGALVVVVMSLAIGQAAAQPNVIANGDFSRGLESWVPYVADPVNTIAVVDDGGNPVLQMSVNAGSGIDWHVQTWQVDGGLAGMSSSTTYTLTFRAKASVQRSLKIELSRWVYEKQEYKYLGLRAKPILGTSWKTYSINFQTDVDPMPTDHVTFWLTVGQEPGTVWVDDVDLRVAPPITYSGTDPLFDFEPSESWLSKSIQNGPNPPDVVPSDTAHVHWGTSALKKPGSRCSAPSRAAPPAGRTPPL